MCSGDLPCTHAHVNVTGLYCMCVTVTTAWSHLFVGHAEACTRGDELQGTLVVSMPHSLMQRRLPQLIYDIQLGPCLNKHLDTRQSPIRSSNMKARVPSVCSAVIMVVKPCLKACVHICTAFHLAHRQG